eukprot:3299371-Pyramimonas_sp.AAC.1
MAARCVRGAVSRARSEGPTTSLTKRRILRMAASRRECPGNFPEISNNATPEINAPFQAHLSPLTPIRISG